MIHRGRTIQRTKCLETQSLRVLIFRLQSPSCLVAARRRATPIVSGRPAATSTWPICRQTAPVVRRGPPAVPVPVIRRRTTPIVRRGPVAVPVPVIRRRTTPVVRRGPPAVYLCFGRGNIHESDYRDREKQCGERRCSLPACPRYWKRRREFKQARHYPTS